MLTLEKIKDAQATLSNAIYKTDVIRASGKSAKDGIVQIPRRGLLDFETGRGRKEKRRHRLFGGQPRAGRRARREQKRDPLSDLPA